jgi:hypothetical protein
MHIIWCLFNSSGTIHSLYLHNEILHHSLNTWAKKYVYIYIYTHEINGRGNPLR